MTLAAETLPRVPASIVPRATATAGHLRDAADALAAGYDLLQMHFATSSTSPQAADSPWAPVISSPAVRAVLLSELAGCAQQLGPCQCCCPRKCPPTA